MYDTPGVTCAFYRVTVRDEINHTKPRSAHKLTLNNIRIVISSAIFKINSNIAPTSLNESLNQLGLEQLGLQHDATNCKCLEAFFD